MTTSNQTKSKHRLELEPIYFPQSHTSPLCPLQERPPNLCDDEAFWFTTCMRTCNYILRLTFKYYVNEVYAMHYSVLPLLLYIMFIRFILRVAYRSSLFIFTEYCNSLYRGKTLFILLQILELLQFFGHYWNENGAMNIFVNITYPISTHTSLEYFLGNGTAKFIKYVALICLILDNVKTFFKVLFIFEQHRFKLCRPTQMSFPINTV